jgi:predicted dehydrogenase
MSEDLCEIAGSEGTLIYRLGNPNHVLVGRKGSSGLVEEPVPAEFLKVPNSPRDPAEGDPVQVFRYDQDFEFIEAIQQGRSCTPSFEDGVRVAAVIDAILKSAETRQWVRIGDL